MLVGPVTTPITLAEVKDILKITISTDDAELGLLIPAAVQLIEQRAGIAMMQQTWEQVQDSAPSPYKILRRPVLSVVKVEYMADNQATAWSLLDASYYYSSRRKVVAVGTWPATRDVGGWKTTFKIGYAALGASPTPEELAAARAAVPANLRLAVAQFVGHMYENKEGEGSDLKYEVIAKKYGALPPNVVTLIEPFFDWSLA